VGVKLGVRDRAAAPDGQLYLSAGEFHRLDGLRRSREGVSAVHEVFLSIGLRESVAFAGRNCCATAGAIPTTARKGITQRTEPAARKIAWFSPRERSSFLLRGKRGRGKNIHKLGENKRQTKFLAPQSRYFDGPRP